MSWNYRIEHARMSWNYRIIRQTQGDYTFFGLHEVYYDDNGAPDGWTAEAISFTCDDDEGPEGICNDLVRALSDAARLPVLTVDGDKLVEWEP